MPLQLRRGTDSQRTNMSQPLAVGELIYVTDTGSIWVGDQAGTIGGLPVANYSLRDIQNIDAALLTSGTHTGITFTYVPNPSNPTLSKINAVVNVQLSNYVGTIKADAFKGTLVGDDSTILVDAVSGKINLNGTVDDDIIPKSFGPDLGSLAIPFNNVYVGGTIKIGSATISASSSRINLPAGSTVGGVTIGTGGAGGGVETGMNYNINIVGDDSTLIVNARTKAINAAGGITGNLTGNLTGNVVGTITTDTIDAPDSTFGLQVNAKKDSSFSTNYYGGTATSKTAIAAGGTVGSIAIKGWNGSGYAFAGGLGTSWDAGANTANDAPLSSVALISGGGGSTFNYAIFDSSGKFTANLFKTTVYSVAGTPLPNAATAGVGARAFVSDATLSTFASPYTGGGAQKVPVYSDGTVWRIG